MEAISLRVLSLYLPFSLTSRRPNHRVYMEARFFPLAHSCLYIGSRRSKSEPSLSLASTPRSAAWSIVPEIGRALWMMMVVAVVESPVFRANGEGKRVTDINVMPGEEGRKEERKERELGGANGRRDD